MPVFGDQYYIRLIEETHEPFRRRYWSQSQAERDDWIDNPQMRQEEFSARLEAAIRKHKEKLGIQPECPLPAEEERKIEQVLKFQTDWYNLPPTKEEKAIHIVHQELRSLIRAVESTPESRWTGRSFAGDLKRLERMANQYQNNDKLHSEAERALAVLNWVKSKGYGWASSGRSSLVKVRQIQPEQGALPPRTTLGGQFEGNRRRH